MKLHSDSTVEEVRIELIPLIDVIFCILIFFILAAIQLTRQQSITVDLPQASTAATETRETMLVSIDMQGQVYIEQEPVTLERLFYEVQIYRHKNPQGVLVVYAAKTALYNDVVQVIDLLRAVGGDRIALATLPTDDPTSDLPTLEPAPGSVTEPSGETSPSLEGGAVAPGESDPSAESLPEDAIPSDAIPSDGAEGEVTPQGETDTGAGGSPPTPNSGEAGGAPPN